MAPAPRCEGCRQKVGPEAKTSDDRYFCDNCLRAQMVWPVGVNEQGRNLYGGGKA